MQTEQLGPREDMQRMMIVELSKIDQFSDYSQVAMIRLLQTICTLMWGDSELIRLAKHNNVVSLVTRIKDAVVDERAKSIARDIVEMTYAV
jgi:hypothetical protein